MKRKLRAESLNLRRFIGTAAMIAAVAELGMVRPLGPQLRPVPIKAIAKISPARGGNRL